jgi:hypothetical protein
MHIAPWLALRSSRRNQAGRPVLPGLVVSLILCRNRLAPGVMSLMPAAWKKREQGGEFMGVALERGAAYQFDVAGTRQTGTWTGARHLNGTPILAELEARGGRIPQDATWFGRLSQVAVSDCFALGDGMVSGANPY